jgi:hypothetical protein
MCAHDVADLSSSAALCFSALHHAGPQTPARVQLKYVSICVKEDSFRVLVDMPPSCLGLHQEYYYYVRQPRLVDISKPKTQLYFAGFVWFLLCGFRATALIFIQQLLRTCRHDRVCKKSIKSRNTFRHFAKILLCSSCVIPKPKRVMRTLSA